MDFVKNLAGGNKEGEQQTQQQTTSSSSSSGGGWSDKLNSMAGGGAAGEKNEDALDKGKPPSSFIYQCKSQSCVCVSVSVSNLWFVLNGRCRLGSGAHHGTR